MYLLIFLLLIFLIVIIKKKKENFIFSNENVIFKKYIKFYPWERGIKKYSNFNLIPDTDISSNEKKIISSILVVKILYSLENKYNLSLFLKNKNYYPKTYLYDNVNKYIPDDDDVWFVKECNYKTYGGNGLDIGKGYESIRSLIKDDEKYIIQKNIDNLLLFNGVKGDFRLYYLVIFYKNKLNFYLYRKGFVKLAKEKFDSKKLSKSTYVTNSTQIKKKDNVNNRSLVFDENFNEYILLYSKIREVFLDVSFEIKDKFPKFYSSSYNLEYQLCGPDIVFTNDYKPYLMELNPNFPAYLYKNSVEIINLKQKMANIISKNLIDNALNGNEINLEEHGFDLLL